MTLNAVQQFVRGTLDGLPTVYMPAPLAAYIAPPQTEDMGAHPLAFIWGSHGSEDRKTGGAGPRGPAQAAGFKKVVHQLRIWLSVAMAADDPHLDSAFPILIDTVEQALRRVALAQPLTDPDTNVVSQLTAIGEKFEWDYDVLRGLDLEGAVMLSALLICEVIEYVQG